MLIDIIKIVTPKFVKYYAKTKFLNLKDPNAMRLNSWRFGRIERNQIADVFPGIGKVQVTLLNCLDGTLGTSLDPFEMICLLAIAKFTRASRICEIGTFDGNTILNLAANTPDNSHLVTVDLPAQWEGRYALSVPNHKINVTERSKLGVQYRNTIYEKKIAQIYVDSALLVWDDLHGPFDLIFIDGCHEYQYVKTDSENAIAHLSDNGIIVWHDYGGIEDVSVLVDQFQHKLLIKVIAGTRLAVGFRRF